MLITLHEHQVYYCIQKRRKFAQRNDQQKKSHAPAFLLNLGDFLINHLLTIIFHTGSFFSTHDIIPRAGRRGLCGHSSCCPSVSLTRPLVPHEPAEMPYVRYPMIPHHPAMSSAAFWAKMWPSGGTQAKTPRVQLQLAYVAVSWRGCSCTGMRESG